MAESTLPSCPLPLRDYPSIVLGHGGGGQLSAELIQHLFLPAFANPILNEMGDAALLPVNNARMAFSTDSYVVRPLFFPGGNIGTLAVNGTINDVAMSGARPLFLSAGFIIEEGFSLEELAAIVDTMAKAAARAGVQIVTGDTKVVEKGHGDGCYINTTGIGAIPAGINMGPHLLQPGDAVIVSGTIGDHGMAVMSVREGLKFESTIRSDSAPLTGLVETMLDRSPQIRALRDPTRGGLASALNEFAKSSNVGIAVDEPAIPVGRETQSACDLLGLDPLFVANEGKLVAIVAAEDAEGLVQRMRDHELGQRAAIIGRVSNDHRGIVVAKTAIGGRRVITMQIGEQLPRIC
jgi:hydrogenase expression/formation protein HypE